MQQKERPCLKSNIYENYLGFLWLRTTQYSRAVEQSEQT